MEGNIRNIQIFMNVTQYYSPPSKTNYKLFIILTFNSDKYKTFLCYLSFIENENIEASITILNHLKIKFNFISFSKSEYKVLKKIYPNINKIPCFFHFMNNMIKLLPDIRKKNGI